MISSAGKDAPVLRHTDAMLEHAGKKATLTNATRSFCQRANGRFMRCWVFRRMTISV
jgi:hypothetical protein